MVKRNLPIVLIVYRARSKDFKSYTVQYYTYIDHEQFVQNGKDDRFEQKDNNKEVTLSDRRLVAASHILSVRKFKSIGQTILVKHLVILFSVW